MDFSSFLIQKTKFPREIKQIVVFGSATRGDSDDDSDIDIFIDLAVEKKNIEQDFNKCLSDFTSSAKYNNYWKLMGASNKIKLTIGKIDKWKKLQPGMISNGLVLYGKYKSELKEGKHQTIFVWENIKPNSKRVLLNKQLFGFYQGGKFYEGAVQRFNGQRMGKGCILVSLDHANTFHQIFKKHQIPVKIKKFIEY